MEVQSTPTDKTIHKQILLYSIYDQMSWITWINVKKNVLNRKMKSIHCNHKIFNCFSFEIISFDFICSNLRKKFISKIIGGNLLPYRREQA